MNQSPEKVLHYLTGTANFPAVQVDDLQKLVAESPYFPVTQFLLAKKLKGENEQYKQQVQKTVLYFSNPYWLQYQLNGEDVQEDFQDVTNRAIADKAEAVVAKTEVASIEETHPITTQFSNDELVTAGNLAHHTLQQAAETQAIANDSQVEKVFLVPAYEQIVEEPGHPDLNQEEEEAATISRDTDRETDRETEVFLNQLDTVPGTTEEKHTVLLNNVSAEAETEVVEYEEEMAGVSHETNKTTGHFLKDLAPPPGNDVQPEQDDEHDRMFRNIKAMLDASTEEADADTKDAVIPIDPYYTIDYFASQGIKLELDQNPQDQLGQHLKKFTQWLRHMKKLGPEDATEVINRTESEADIQQIADSSNTVREVVTEAMASVLEKQGKKDKAIELYNKLSFLNPDKNAYFAGKIKKLKGF